MYAEKIMEHYKNPRNQGKIKDPDYEGEAGNVQCGDKIRFFLKTRNSVVEKAKFRGQGCAISIAFASMLTQIAKGKTIKELKKMSKQEFLEKIHKKIQDSREKCATTAFRAMKNAIEKGSFMC